MREHRLPVPDTVCDRLIAVALAFLNLGWVYIESCRWPLGMLCSLPHSACMNKLYFTKKASACSCLKNCNVIDCALNISDCLKQMFVHEFVQHTEALLELTCFTS